MSKEKPTPKDSSIDDYPTVDLANGKNDPLKIILELEKKLNLVKHHIAKDDLKSALEHSRFVNDKGAELEGLLLKPETIKYQENYSH